MRSDRTRDSVANSILVGLIFGGVIYWQTRDLVQVLPATAIMAASLYLGSVFSNRIAQRIAKRISPREVEVLPPEQTTERPDHALRRRTRRRPRGRRA
ncbi:MAG: hypothetical protein EXR66_04225 [Dehalococcoidia bacterium]|nr:hypothetical protein [Dehalococcoidia bacterium]